MYSPGSCLGRKNGFWDCQGGCLVNNGNFIGICRIIKFCITLTSNNNLILLPMASTTETGHAKNIANLNKINEIIGGFGTDYNPSNTLYKLTNMQTLYTTCEGLQEDANTETGIFKPIVNARKIEFNPVKRTMRRVRSSAKVSGASTQSVADVNTIVTKILGERASLAKATANDPAGTSASQQGFDNIANNVQALVKLLSKEPLYAPNEADLKISALSAKYTALVTANKAVAKGEVPYKKAITKRNKALYTDTTGLVDVGQGSKDYIRSVFGLSSPEFKLVSKIKFTKLVDV